MLLGSLPSCPTVSSWVLRLLHSGFLGPAVRELYGCRSQRGFGMWKRLRGRASPWDVIGTVPGATQGTRESGAL